MEKEELLKPRYKVIADYPNSEMPVGLVVKNLYAATWGDGKEYQFEESELWFKRYPHLFKKLEWWEERAVEDMPEYVKNNLGVYRVEQWLINSTHNPWAVIGDGLSDFAKAFTPITKEEYETFIKRG